MLFSRRLFLASASSAGFVGSCGSGGNAPPPPPPGPPPPGTVNFAFSFADNLAGWEPAWRRFRARPRSEHRLRFRSRAAAGAAATIDPASTLREPQPVRRRLHVHRSPARRASHRHPLSGLHQCHHRHRRAAGCVGIGGAPGEGVTVKAGACGFRPENRVEQGSARVSFDKGNQAQGGAHVGACHRQSGAGQSGAGTCLQPAYQRKTLTTRLQTWFAGRPAHPSGPPAWLAIGTDSGFERPTRVDAPEGRRHPRRRPDPARSRPFRLPPPGRTDRV